MSALDIPSVIDVTAESEPALLRLVPALAGLGPNALTILAEIAERLQRGAKQYGGDFTDKPRDWAQETFEELADGLVYSTMKLQELRAQREADAQRQAAALRLDDATQAAWRPRDPSRLGPRDGAAPAPQRWSPTESRYVPVEPPDGSGCG